jgi:hypothetical protein
VKREAAGLLGEPPVPATSPARFTPSAQRCSSATVATIVPEVALTVHWVARSVDPSASLLRPTTKTCPAATSLTAKPALFE